MTLLGNATLGYAMVSALVSAAIMGMQISKYGCFAADQPRLLELLYQGNNTGLGSGLTDFADPCVSGNYFLLSVLLCMLAVVISNEILLLCACFFTTTSSFQMAQLFLWYVDESSTQRFRPASSPIPSGKDDPNADDFQQLGAAFIFGIAAQLLAVLGACHSLAARRAALGRPTWKTSSYSSDEFHLRCCLVALVVVMLLVSFPMQMVIYTQANTQGDDDYFVPDSWQIAPPPNTLLAVYFFLLAIAFNVETMYYAAAFFSTEQLKAGAQLLQTVHAETTQRGPLHTFAEVHRTGAFIAIVCALLVLLLCVYFTWSIRAASAAPAGYTALPAAPERPLTEPTAGNIGMLHLYDRARARSGSTLNGVAEGESAY
jgi:hypothetical protein